MTEQGKVKRKPTLAESLMAVLFLIIIIVVGNVFFGLSVELMFVVAIFFVGYIGKRCGFTYKEIKDGMIGCVAENAEMMVIMLGIGFVIGTWVFAGTVPVMIGWLAELISGKICFGFIICFLRHYRYDYRYLQCNDGYHRCYHAGCCNHSGYKPRYRSGGCYQRLLHRAGLFSAGRYG